MTARLIVPCKEYLQSYLEACQDFKRHESNTSVLHNPDTFEVWRRTIFRRYKNERRGRRLAKGYVPASTFWLVENGEFIGVGNIRHRLTESLERYGGHIGYAIRRDKWGQGYGTLQLKLLLREAAALGIQKALITCDENNIASARVMEKNGAIYQDTIDNVIDGVPTRSKRYWVDTAINGE